MILRSDCHLNDSSADSASATSNWCCSKCMSVYRSPACTIISWWSLCSMCYLGRTCSHVRFTSRGLGTINPVSCGDKASFEALNCQQLVHAFGVWVIWTRDCTGLHRASDLKGIWLAERKTLTRMRPTLKSFQLVGRCGERSLSSMYRAGITFSIVKCPKPLQMILENLTQNFGNVSSSWVNCVFKRGEIVCEYIPIYAIHMTDLNGQRQPWMPSSRVH